MAEAADFGRLLAQYRHERGWSQKELAGRANLSESTLGNLESGRIRRPHQETVRLLATALNLAPARRQQLLDAARDRAAVPPLAPNLPHAPSSFIGREREREQTRDLLLREDVRLVTLTGPGGTGKTRLALQVAADGIDAFEHGVFFVDLAPLTDPDLVVNGASVRYTCPNGC